MHPKISGNILMTDGTGVSSTDQELYRSNGSRRTPWPRFLGDASGLPHMLKEGPWKRVLRAAVLLDQAEINVHVADYGS